MWVGPVLRGGTELTGTIPESIGQLTQLQMLMLNAYHENALAQAGMPLCAEGNRSSSGTSEEGGCAVLCPAGMRGQF